MEIKPVISPGVLQIAIFAVVLMAFIVVIDGMFTGYIISFQGSGTVTRSVNPDTVNQGDTVTVTLDISLVAGEDFFILDEIYPTGFVLSSNPDNLDTSEPDHLKKVVFQGATSTAYTYALTAPADYAIHNFGGTYQIDGMGGTAIIGGEDTVTVEFQSSPEICNNNDDDGDTEVDEGCDDDGDTYADSSMSCIGSFLDGGSQIRACASNGGDCNDVAVSGLYINPGSNVYCDCNSGTGGGSTQGTTEICGNGVDEDCNGVDLQCCTLTSAEWNDTFVWDWQTVKLTVEGSAQCGAETVYLWLFESDGPSSDFVDAIDLGTMTLNGGTATKEWDAVWIRDNGDLDETPEYFFKANITTCGEPPCSSASSDNLRVDTEDEDKDGVLDVNDCNDADQDIGECTGCSVCSDASKHTGTCIGGTCAPVTCGGSCGYGSCGQTYLPEFDTPTQTPSCNVQGNEGTCEFTQCIEDRCTYSIACEDDDDSDGVPNPADDCPNSAQSHIDGNIINTQGCPMPTATEFSSGLTTDFLNEDLLNVENLSLGIDDLGQIKFLGYTPIITYSTANGRYEPVDIDSNVNIIFSSIDVNAEESTGMIMVNDKESHLNMFELEIAYPVPWKDASICSNCQFLRPEEYSGAPGNPDTLGMWVPGFTEYGIKDSYCGDGYCYQGDGLEDCLSCSDDCGTCPCDDDDGDGYGECPFCGTVETTGVDCLFEGDDCNDDPVSGAGINPGATEIVYNGIDDDCNLLTRDFDIDGDNNNASGYGGSDCNDNTNTIGECNAFTGPSGCAYCTDSTGLSGTCEADDSLCPAQDCSDSVICGYGTCGLDQKPVFDNPTEPGVCSMTGDDGDCSSPGCQNYVCQNEAGCLSDTDLDGVPDFNDECPNTQGTDRNEVNVYGCPKPIMTRFTPDLSTNFTVGNLSNASNITLGITNLGQIKFIGNLVIMEYLSAYSRYTRVNLDKNVNISFNLASVNSTALPMLNKPGLIRLFNLTFTRPVVLKNGELCGNDCRIIQYLGGANITFYVVDFTDYSTREHFCGDGRCDDDLDETCLCADCPACPKDDPDDDDSPGGPSSNGPSDACGRKPIQPCSVAVWMDWPNCEWDTSQCATASENCSEGEMRCSGDYLQRCEVRSPAAWHPVKVCLYGCNTSTLTCNAFLVTCREDWVCQQWGECTEGQQTRLCFDNNECKTFFDKPLEVKTCGLPMIPFLDNTWITVFIMTIIVITSVMIAVLALKLRNKRRVVSASTPYNVETSPSIKT